ncbi:hypothetical protein ACH5RR_014221 [Cinchona calisaya]|uniref:Uncharacterized protein n=1 Tax=Cinchona calisaya TaxID=153742 RepID=A0ABD3A2C2_9GENT
MEPEHVRGNSKDSKLNLEAKHNPGEPTTEDTFSELHPEAKHDDTKPSTEGGSILGIKQHPKAKNDDDGMNSEGNVSRLSSSSSSSSSTLPDDHHLDDSFIKAEQYESISSLDVSTQNPQWSMMSVSPRAGSGNLSSTDVLPHTPEWIMINSSPIKSPPIQAMGKGYDPNRIPSSIFSTKPSTPMDWSVASNESLFSIHMGNNSFSRDNAILQGLDFSRPEEWNSSPLIQSNTELNNFTSNLSPVAEVAEKRSSNIYVREGLEDDDFHETPKLVHKEKPAPDADGVRLSTSSNYSDGRGVPPAEAIHSPVCGPRVSNESTKSSDSFAFPVLLNDGGKGGSLKVNSEKHETTHSQLPNDDHGGKGSSLKVNSGKPDQKTHSQPQEDPKVASASWFSCLSCWPRQCC